MIEETARRFLEEDIIPRMDRLEHQDWQATLELMRKAGEIGLLAVEIPEAYGGLGLDKVSSSLISETLIRGGAFALTYGGHVGIGTLPIVLFGNEEQKQRYLPAFAAGDRLAAYALTEPGSGSDALSVRTTAVLSADGEHYVLNGTKQFITNAAFADVFIVYAKIDGQHFSAFIVEKDAAGFSTGPEERKMGIKSSSTRQVILNNVKVPKANLLGQPGRGHVVAFNVLNFGRHKLAAGCVGMMKQAIELAVRYARERRQFGRAIAEFSLIQGKIADMNIRTYVAESMVYRTAGDMDRELARLDRSASGEQTARTIANFALECSMNKVYASEALDFVVDESLQIHGGSGYIQEYEIERLYRDARINRIFEGTNEINRLIIPTMLFRKWQSGKWAAGRPATTAGSNHAGTDNTAGGADERLDSPGCAALQEEWAMLRAAKATGWWISSIVSERCEPDIHGEQEILACLADILIETYALESAFLRAAKAIQRVSDPAAPADGIQHQIDMVRVCAREALDRVWAAARDILAMLEQGEALNKWLATLSRLAPPGRPLNKRALKRQIAARVLAAGRYRA
ncbi:MAG: acyl-CoA dehydrogenase family protein [Alicyclobacillaceae bacterium]|nr:acyl-CoA dehydrogenase family protein [Alicyclobacillaceae bacterium]